jgi:hypothetical protein
MSNLLNNICCRTVSFKYFLVINAVDGVDSIMDYLKEVFWRCCFPIDLCESGFDLRRFNWMLLNRFRTKQGRCTHLMYRWGFVESPACDCGAEEHTMRPIVDDCPLQLFGPMV